MHRTKHDACIEYGGNACFAPTHVDNGVQSTVFAMSTVYPSYRLLLPCTSESQYLECQDVCQKRTLAEILTAINSTVQPCGVSGQRLYLASLCTSSGGGHQQQ